MNRRLTACLAAACLILLVLVSGALGASARPHAMAKPHAVAKPSTTKASCHDCRGTFAAPTVGEVLTTTNGTWTNSPTSFTYQWEDCNSGGTSCTSITGATSQSYTLVTADVAHTIVVVVTAANSAGSASNASSASGLVTAPVPVNSTVPTVSGSVTQGSTLTATNGTWTNSPTGYATQWYECPTSCTGSNFTAISGAVGNTYVTESTDVGDVLYATVTASNASGAGTPASSTDTAVITSAAEAPVSTGTDPVISGTATQGDVLTATGTGATYWDNTPTSYTYQWAECPTSCSGAGTHISGATSSTYTLQSSDVGDVVYVGVTATNATGSATAYSSGTVPVASSGGGGGGGGNGTGIFTGSFNSTLSNYPTVLANSGSLTEISSSEEQYTITTASSTGGVDSHYRADLLTANWYPSGTNECTSIPVQFPAGSSLPGVSGFLQFAEMKDTTAPYAGWGFYLNNYYTGSTNQFLFQSNAQGGLPVYWSSSTSLDAGIHTLSICTNDSNSTSGEIYGIYLDGVLQNFNHDGQTGTTLSGFPIIYEGTGGGENTTWPLDINVYTGGAPVPVTANHGQPLIATMGTNDLPPEPLGGWSSFS